MLGDGAGSFVDASAASADFGALLEVSRGLVPFDLEGDGDLDLLVSNLEGPARIYRNESITDSTTAAVAGLGTASGRRSRTAAHRPRRFRRRPDL